MDDSWDHFVKHFEENGRQHLKDSHPLTLFPTMGGIHPDMRKVEILPQTDFWGLEISSTLRVSRPLFCGKGLLMKSCGK